MPKGKISQNITFNFNNTNQLIGISCPKTMAYDADVVLHATIGTMLHDLAALNPAAPATFADVRRTWKETLENYAKKFLWLAANKYTITDDYIETQAVCYKWLAKHIQYLGV